jgi:hypothetical protein
MSILAIVGAAGGGVWALETRYALDGELQQIAGRLDSKILRDRYYWLQQRLWAIQDRLGEGCGVMAGQCREIKAEMDRIDRELQK